MAAQDSPYLTDLRRILLEAPAGKDLYDVIVNAPFKDQLAATQLGLGIIVLLLEDVPGKVINRIASSATENAAGAARMASNPFHEISILADDPNNLIAKTVKTGNPSETTDWENLFTPSLSAQDARLNQAGAGVEYSVVYPLSGKIKGALIFSYYEPPQAINQSHREFMRAYTALAGEQLAKH